jgi:ferric-dicitrate binding protein FerR (iron transport regulator)
LTVNGTAARVLKADIEAVTAWKNGLFLFNGTDLLEVMQQLARWYDVKIEYDPAFRERKFFTGEIRRNVPVSKLLEMMELTGIARFRIMNNTIMISAYSP